MTSVAAQGQHRDLAAHVGFEQPTSKHFGGRERPMADLALVGEGDGMGNGSHGRNGREVAIDRAPIAGTSRKARLPAAHKRTGSSAQRSRQGNLVERIAETDGRTSISRRFKEITGALIADSGGAERCSESRVQLIRRFAATCVLAEAMEARLANGEAINIAEHALLCSTLTRLAGRVGIERRAREIVPTLQGYLDSIAETKSAPEADAARETDQSLVSADEAAE
jgi:hypothetical protein